MFIGHYAVAPIAAATGKVKLWQAFIAVQFVDFVWAVLNLLGVEKTRIIKDFTASNHVDLYHMPFSHSLLFTVFWAVIAGGLFWLYNGRRNNGGTLIIIMLVISHWVFDVIVHAPDMTIMPGGEKFGYGLWNNLWAALALEIGLIVGAMTIYIRLTVPASRRSLFWTLAFCGFLIALQMYQTFGPVPPSVPQLAIMALLGFSLIALAACLYEGTRHLYYEIVEDVYEPH